MCAHVCVRDDACFHVCVHVDAYARLCDDADAYAYHDDYDHDDDHACDPGDARVYDPNDANVYARDDDHAYVHQFAYARVYVHHDDCDDATRDAYDHARFYDCAHVFLDVRACAHRDAYVRGDLGAGACAHVGVCVDRRVYGRVLVYGCACGRVCVDGSGLQRVLHHERGLHGQKTLSRKVLLLYGSFWC